MNRRGWSLNARLLLAVLLLAPMLGCEDQNAVGRHVLSGAVTYDGQPVTNGTIELFPTDVSKKPAGAKIVDGRYEMDRTLGPEPGSYQVVILAERPSGRQEPADEGSSEMVNIPVQYIPPIYNTRTTLSVEVTGDQENVDFALDKPKRGSRRRR
ncbi:MAG: hypothetical protein ACR2NM_08705 [Bythopirellula sp.]